MHVVHQFLFNIISCILCGIGCTDHKYSHLRSTFHWELLFGWAEEVKLSTGSTFSSIHAQSKCSSKCMQVNEMWVISTTQMRPLAYISQNHSYTWGTDAIASGFQLALQTFLSYHSSTKYDFTLGLQPFNDCISCIKDSFLQSNFNYNEIHRLSRIENQCYLKFLFSDSGVL